MSRQADRERLEQAIKDAEARLRVFRGSLEGIAQELRDLRTVETLLTDNIECLKTIKITIKMTEYKKAKEDLNKTKARIAMIRMDHDKIQKAGEEIAEYLIRSRTELVDSLREPDNILEFRRKNAKE
jgi:small-conductance mechanosensitive channel